MLRSAIFASPLALRVPVHPAKACAQGSPHTAALVALRSVRAGWYGRPLD